MMDKQSFCLLDAVPGHLALGTEAPSKCRSGTVTTDPVPVIWANLQAVCQQIAITQISIHGRRSSFVTGISSMRTRGTLVRERSVRVEGSCDYRTEASTLTTADPEST
jgi:hypothetical protein